MLYSFFLSCLFILVPLLVFKKYFYFSSINLRDGISILIMISAACLPFMIYRFIQKCFYPTKVEIIIHEAKIKNKRLKIPKNLNKDKK